MTRASRFVCDEEVIADEFVLVDEAKGHEDQPRDERGRWTDDGGSAEADDSSGSVSTAAQHKTELRDRALQAVNRMRQEADDLWSGAKEQIAAMNDGAEVNAETALDFVIKNTLLMESDFSDPGMQRVIYDRIMSSITIRGDLEAQRVARSVAIAASKEIAANIIDGFGGSKSLPDLDNFVSDGRFGVNAENREELDRRERELEHMIGKGAMEAYSSMLHEDSLRCAVCIHRSDNATKRILSGGRVKTQFETNRSGGMLSTEYRDEVEEKLFAAHQTEATNRPVYGILYTRDLIDSAFKDGNMRGFSYGRYILRLNESARDHATFTGSDSLSLKRMYGDYPDGRVLASYQPSSVLSPSLVSVTDYDDWSSSKYTGAVAENVRDAIYGARRSVGNSMQTGVYAEAQMHGGVTVNQIETVYDTSPMKDRPPNPEIMAHARMNGIDYLQLDREYGGERKWTKLN